MCIRDRCNATQLTVLQLEPSEIRLRKHEVCFVVRVTIVLPVPEGLCDVLYKFPKAFATLLPAVYLVLDKKINTNSSILHYRVLKKLRQNKTNSISCKI